MNLLAPGFSYTKYFSMSILRGSVTVGEVVLFIDASLAWDQAPPWGNKSNKLKMTYKRSTVLTLKSFLLFLFK